MLSMYVKYGMCFSIDIKNNVKIWVSLLLYVLYMYMYW